MVSYPVLLTGGMTLRSDIPKPELDAWLHSAFGVQGNTHTVKELHDATKVAGAWAMAVTKLGLNESEGVRLAVALHEAFALPKNTTPKQTSGNKRPREV